MTSTMRSELRLAVAPQVEKIVASGNDVRLRLTKVVSEAACRCHEIDEGFVELTHAVIDGAREGISKSMSNNRDDVLRQVVDALGDGLSHTALAARLAVEEAVSSSRRYAESDLRRLRDDLTAVRDLFTESVTQALNTGKALTENQVAKAKTHANRVAERLGPAFTSVLDAVRENPTVLARESIQAGVNAGQGAAESLGEALRHLLKRACNKLDQER